MKHLLVITGLTFLFFLKSNAQPPEQSRVTVTGEGIVHVVPDRADLFFGIRTEGEEVAFVKQENDRLVAQMLKMLEQMGIAKEDVQTQRLALHKNFDHRIKKETYYATQNFVVRIKDLSAYNEVTAALLTSGVNQIERVSFGHSQAEKYETEARRAAVADALEKVDLYSKALGRSPGSLILLEEDGGHAPGPVYRMAMSEAQNDGGSTIAPGELKITARVKLIQGLK